jgi:hypothetical protein
MTKLESLKSFRRNSDGTWSVIKPISIGGVRMGPGFTFSRGASFCGLDVATVLDRMAAGYASLAPSQSQGHGRSGFG